MGLLQEIFCTHGPRYLERFGATMPQAHKQVIEAIAGCCSSANGAIVYQCEGCGEQQWMPRCCGNRHCPLCQQGKAYRWLQRQIERQLPAPYFMLTFTVPEALRPFLRRHQRIGYGALFEASAGAIKKLAPDPNYLGADTPGFFGVLHTWGRTLQYHPHIHYVVPGGAFDSETRLWHGCSATFYAPVRALSPIFRAKFRDAMDAAGLLGEIAPEVWTIDWNVNCLPVGDGAATMRYLSRYVFKVAIAQSRIVAVDDEVVRFHYRKPHSNRVRTMALPILEFMHRFLQHVLPRGLMKLRYYGFLSPSFSMPIEEVKARIEMANGFAVAASAAEIEPLAPAPLCCPRCAGVLRYVRVILPPPRSASPTLASRTSAMMSVPASG
jgi:hypothetical protein